MAGTGVIEDFVSAKAFQQLERVEIYLSSLNIALVEGIKNAKAYSDALAGAKGLREVTTQTADASKELERLNALQAKTATAIANRNAAEQRAAAAIIRTTQAQERATAQSERQRAAQDRLNASTRAAQGEYAKLLAAYNAATLAARNAGAQFGTQSTQFAEAGARVRVLRAELDAIDQPLGNFQRNVGNYANGIVRFGQRAFGAIRLIANILPGLGLSGAFLLIFEGLQFAVEKLGIFSAKAKNELTDVQKFAKDAADSVAGDFAKLNILYEASQNVNLPLSQRLSVVKELQKEYPAYFGNLSKEAILAGEAASAYENLSNALIQKAVISAGQKNLEEALKPLIELRTELNRQQAVIDKENADRQLKNPSKQTSFELTDQNGKKIPGMRDVVSSGAVNKVRQGDFIVDKNGDLKTLTQYQKEITDKVKEVNAGIQLALQDFGINGLLDPARKEKKPKKIADTRKQVLDQQLKDAKLSQDTILQDEKSSFEDRILAVADYENTVSNLLAKARKAKVITALEESNYFKALDLETAKERKDIADKVNKELQKAFEDGVKNANTALQQEIIDLRDAQDTKLLEIEQYQADALNATADLYRQGKISVAEYNQKVYDIEKQAAAERIQLQIDTLEKILATQKENLSFGIGDPKDVQKTQNMITKMRIDASNLETKTILDNVNKVKQARKDLHDLEKQIADQSIELIQTLVDGSYQRQLDALSAQSDQLTANADKEKEVVDRSLATDEEKANKKKIIDAKTQSQQEVIAAKEREVKTRQAKFDKAISIVKIIEATGIAEVNALAYLSNPFTAPLYPAIAAAIGALGALQLATVIATPIPKYAKGTDYHKGGAMIVGDAGTELVIEPNGKRYLTPDTDTLTTAPAGTKVLPNHEVIKMLAKPERINYVGGQAVDIQQLVSEQRKTTKAIQGQKMAGTFITKGGWKRQQQQVSNWNAYRNNHFN